MGEAGLKRATAYGNATLMIAANLPDVDALAFFLDTPSVALRRGWTHGVVAQALLPLALTAGVVAWGRWRGARGGQPVRPLAVLALSYLGLFSHVFLDYLNVYGVRLLMPLDRQWFYGDALFIIDPWLWLALGAGVFFSRRGRSVAPAGAALAIATLYIAGMLWLASTSRQAVLAAWTNTYGAPPRALMVGPVPLHPFNKEVIVDAGNHYVLGSYSAWPRGIRFEPDRVPKNESHPAAVKAQEDADVRAVLVWARFPHYVIEAAPGGTRVTLEDARYGRRVGSATVVVTP